MAVEELDHSGQPGTGRLGAEFAVLAESLLSARTVREVLEHVVRAGAALVAGADLVSVTLRGDDGTFHTPVETGGLASRLDELQYRFDEGPCVAATRTAGLAMVDAADVVGEFPRWGPAAVELGVCGALAVGLFPRSEPPRMGALNFYSFTPGGLADADRDVALILAAHAAAALAATHAVTAAELEADQLRDALRTRDVIGQAKGILMERRGIDADQAFDVLRRVSQSLNLKLTHVAETLATRREDI